MARLGCLDVGSNTLTLLVAEGGGTQWRAVHEALRITRLGQGLQPGRPFDPEAFERSIVGLAQLAAEARAAGAQRVVGVATAAARDASDGARLVDRAAEVGVDLRIVSGAEEAALSWSAAWHDFGGAALRVVDVGGRSTELIHGAGPISPDAVSLPLGSVALTEAFEGDRAAMDDRIQRSLSGLSLPAGGRFIAVAGTATTLACLDLALTRWDSERVHGHELSRATLGDWAERLWAASLEERLALPGMVEERADVLPAGALVLWRILEAAGAERVTISDRGVRWGLLYAQGR